MPPPRGGGEQPAGMGLRVAQPRPRVLQHGGPDRGGQVQSLAVRAVHVELGHDPEGLRVALETVGQAEPGPGDPVQDPFAEVTERRVAQIVRAGRGLHDDRIAATELFGQRGVGAGPNRGRDGPGDRGHLDGVGQPVVHHLTGGALRDHLGDGRQPGEVRREPDPLQIGAKRALGGGLDRIVRRPSTRRGFGEPSNQPRIHGTEPTVIGRGARIDRARHGRHHRIRRRHRAPVGSFIAAADQRRRSCRRAPRTRRWSAAAGCAGPARASG